ncbi:MAG: IS200/IS605 family element transposase accessory protein TnpB [Caldilineaceae bacterium SB0661_bin_32]|uniref:IS200/IS605 family element transposase accessory protein TnpB n=1 Tax=Caldilineaceae bacterium SB0661_bin_32 TaxID=2605255 RepID=A0A6B1DAS8_9CHLR|nr:IS200/IS605 family element transposase accessory protein TnpB [Caldilineaceae bacterium SB0665_bin_25]MYC96405.1 IS200/IS605 family element transposase accessory protein TnpB [Caldilineaceae bacterium SB0661_bin_32]
MTTTIVRAHKIRLVPTRQQEQHFVQACGTARFAYNWGLAEWKRLYQAGMKPNARQLDKRLNAIKQARFPWMYEASKWAAQMALQNLGNAFKNFFSRRGKYPRFKKKGRAALSFVCAVGIQEIKVRDKRLWVPKLGWVKMRQRLRFEGKPLRVTISKTADQWYAAIGVEMTWVVPVRKNQADGGLDVGISPLAVESDGTRWENPQALNKELRKLRRWSRRLSRRTQGSRGHREAQLRIAGTHKRIADIRADCHHNLSRSVVDKYSRLGVEDLNVSGLVKNRRLSRHLSDAALGELLRQVRYKAEQYGTEIVEASRFFPSSKTCSACGRKNESLTLSDKQWICECGVQHDRDRNAAINLRNYCRAGYARTTPMDSEALAARSFGGETTLGEVGI